MGKILVVCIEDKSHLVENFMHDSVLLLSLGGPWHVPLNISNSYAKVFSKAALRITQIPICLL